MAHAVFVRDISHVGELGARCSKPCVQADSHRDEEEKGQKSNNLHVMSTHMGGLVGSISDGAQT
jgi:hypothetical protein